MPLKLFGETYYEVTINYKLNLQVHLLEKMSEEALLSTNLFVTWVLQHSTYFKNS